MPKRKPVEDKRVPLNCLILPKTRALFDGMTCSQGEAVDRWASAWLMERAQGRIESYTPAIEEKIKANITSRNPVEVVGIRSGYSELDAVGPVVSSGRGKASVQTWRREPRQKGDQSR